MLKCSICNGANYINPTFTETKITDEQGNQLIEIEYHTDIYCRSCRGLVRYYHYVKKMDFPAILQKLASQFEWLQRKPINLAVIQRQGLTVFLGY